jgi:hypothetical protein
LSSAASFARKARSIRSIARSIGKARSIGLGERWRPSLASRAIAAAVQEWRGLAVSHVTVRAALARPRATWRGE